MLDIGVEDDATGAPLSVKKTDAALGELEGLVTVGMLLAHDVLSMLAEMPALGAELAALVTIRDAAATLTERSPAEFHRTGRAAIPRAIIPPDLCCGPVDIDDLAGRKR